MLNLPLPEHLLREAARYAAQGQFAPLAALADHHLASDSPVLVPSLELGALLSAYGFLSSAQRCYERAARLSPADLSAVSNLANIERERGEHHASSRRYIDLLRQLPDNALIRRNALAGLEYDPESSDVERLRHARDWGQWAIARAGGPRPRPVLAPLDARNHCPLRLGYISADFCQHTVGLFVKDVLKAHDPNRVEVFAYSAGQVKDWVTDEIRAACTFRDVIALDDGILAEQIRADGIDVLVDLSGHTGGSRLTAFAHRPSPSAGDGELAGLLRHDWIAISGRRAAR